TAGVRLGVDGFGLGVEVLVDGDHLSGHRGVDVRGGLHRFDHRDLFTLGDAAADRRQFDEHDVAELILGEVGDADGHATVALHAGPLVALGVAELNWGVHASPYESGQDR